eukprot:CAMPEP_0184357064 /NCGR_PEP_ID=MMETSP1089-20130417/106815_1 /TAXON_ID=38269 ORGANISM="Gloeochaete wittrockiana, Strain SAG46.84" /NCGR_SAMPLE_ID=MMETSP1089 /ASSEMBLY_ACC=CAM_ASM_000445 /LENGTH=59 /DNA_ID=CAMNT_0026694635 /DNA_START=31 /DNA_END=210 /DNA_ORIENTATION=-
MAVASLQVSAKWFSSVSLYTDETYAKKRSLLPGPVPSLWSMASLGNGNGRGWTLADITE